MRTIKYAAHTAHAAHIARNAALWSVDCNTRCAAEHAIARHSFASHACRSSPISRSVRFATVRLSNKFLR